MSIDVYPTSSAESPRGKVVPSEGKNGKQAVNEDGDLLFDYRRPDGTHVTITEQRYMKLLDSGEVDVPHSGEPVSDEFETPLAHAAKQLDSSGNPILGVPKTPKAIDPMTGKVSYTRGFPNTTDQLTDTAQAKPHSRRNKTIAAVAGASLLVLSGGTLTYQLVKPDSVAAQPGNTDPSANPSTTPGSVEHTPGTSPTDIPSTTTSVSAPETQAPTGELAEYAAVGMEVDTSNLLPSTVQHLKQLSPDKLYSMAEDEVPDAFAIKESDLDPSDPQRSYAELVAANNIAAWAVTLHPSVLDDWYDGKFGDMSIDDVVAMYPELAKDSINPQGDGLSNDDKRFVTVVSDDLQISRGAAETTGRKRVPVTMTVKIVSPEVLYKGDPHDGEGFNVRAGFTIKTNDLTAETPYAGMYLPKGAANSLTTSLRIINVLPEGDVFIPHGGIVIEE